MGQRSSTIITMTATIGLHDRGLDFRTIIHPTIGPRIRLASLIRTPGLTIPIGHTIPGGAERRTSGIRHTIRHTTIPTTVIPTIMHIPGMQ